MSFFHSNTRKTGQVRNDLASSSEVQTAFDKEHEDLHWLALVITGDPEIAKESVVNASGLTTTTAGVLHEWLVRWAHSTTARVAAEAIRAEVFVVAARYSDWSYSHPDHKLLSSEQAALLPSWDPLRIDSELDPLQRSVLVLRAIQQFSVAHCALRLNVPRRCALGANLQRTAVGLQQKEANSAYRSVEDGAGNHSSDKVQTHEIRESYPSKGIFQHVRTAIGPCNS